MARPKNPPLRVFEGLTRAWRLTAKEQIGLLGLTAEADIKRLRKVAVAEVPSDIIEGVVLLLDIFEAINTLLPPARACRRVDEEAGFRLDFWRTECD